MILLFETYTSQKQLEKICDQIIEKMADKTDDYFKGKPVNQIMSIKLGEIDNNDEDMKYFIEECEDMLIAIVTPESVTNYNFTEKGMYRTTKSGSFVIFIQEIYSNIIKINEYPKTLYKTRKDAIISYVSKDYKSTLLHEILHAFDDFRSHGKALDMRKSKFYNNVNKFKTLSQKENKTEEEKELLLMFDKDYLNVRFEVDARLSQALYKINFFNLDLDLSLEYNKDYYKMRDFKDVLRDFKSNMNAFYALDEKQKKRVLTKLGSFYEKEKDLVVKLNKELKQYK